MAAVRVSCPTCHTTLEIDESHVGQEVECGSCMQVFVARRRADRPAETAEEDADDRPRRRRRARRDDYDDDPPGRRGGGDNTAAVIALVLGIVSLPLACCCAVVAIPVQIGGVVSGSIGMKNPHGRGMAVAGLVLSLLGLVLTATLMAIGVGANLANWNNPGQFNRGR